MIHEATSVSQFPHCGHKKKITSIGYVECLSSLSECPLLFYFPSHILIITRISLSELHGFCGIWLLHYFTCLRRRNARNYLNNVEPPFNGSQFKVFPHLMFNFSDPISIISLLNYLQNFHPCSNPLLPPKKILVVISL